MTISMGHIKESVVVVNLHAIKFSKWGSPEIL